MNSQDYLFIKTSFMIKKYNYKDIFCNTINEALLVEEITAGSATVYHRDVTPPEKLLAAGGFLRSHAGSNGGSLYGNGVYCVYDIESNRRGYGEYLYQCHVKSLKGYLILVPEIAKRVYGEWSPWKQIATLIPKKYWKKDSYFYKDIVHYFLLNENGKVSKQKACEYFDTPALGSAGHLQNLANGIPLSRIISGVVYYGANDGYCLLSYDFSNVYIEKYSEDDGNTWTDIKMDAKMYKKQGNLFHEKDKGDFHYNGKRGYLYQVYNDGSTSEFKAEDVKEAVFNGMFMTDIASYGSFLCSAKDGKILLRDVIASLDKFDEKYDRYRLFYESRNYNCIDADGNKLLPQDVPYLSNLYKNGWARISFKDKADYNLINAKGELFFKENSPNPIKPYGNNLAIVEGLDGISIERRDGSNALGVICDKIKVNPDAMSAIISTNGESFSVDANGKTISIGSPESFVPDTHGLFLIRQNGKENFLKKNGEPLSKIWFEYCSLFDKGNVAIVMLNGKENLLNTEGQLVSDKWYSSLIDVGSGFFEVGDNGKYNIMYEDGQLISKSQWFDKVSINNDGVLEAISDGRTYVMDRRGVLTLKQ